MAKQLTKAARENLLSKYHSSGKNQVEWCMENNISKSTLSTWLKKSRTTAKNPPRNSPEQTFIAVQITASSLPPSSITIEISNCKIRVEENFSPSLLTKIIKSLVAIC